jgi:phosphate-selective porin OprO/OprP
MALNGSAFAQSAQDLQKQVDALKGQVDDLKVEVKKATDKASAPLIIKWEPAPSISSPDGLFEMNLRGRIFTDFGWMSDSDDTMDISASEIRMARLGIAGKAWADVKYQLEIEFGGSGGAKLTDAFIEWGKPIAIKIGHFKPPVGMEPSISETNMTFLERASITSAFGMSRQIGAQGTFKQEGFVFQAGVFKGGQSDEAEKEGTIFAVRALYGAKEDDLAYHFGVSYRNRKSGDDAAKFGYKQRPHHHLSNSFVNVGDAFKASSDNWMGVEAAAVYKSFSAQGEWGQLKSNIAAPADGQLDPTYKGGYVEVSYFLTGEQRNYSLGKGSFGSVSPLNPIHEGGMGAWHLGYRFDRIDLSDEGIAGGTQNTHMVALNWLLNKNVRLQANYSTSKVKDALLVAANGVDGANKINTFGLRASVSF